MCKSEMTLQLEEGMGMATEEINSSQDYETEEHPLLLGSCFAWGVPVTASQVSAQDPVHGYKND